MNNKKTIGERVDEVLEKVSEKSEMGKDRMAHAKKDVAGIAHDISKSAKKAVHDTGDAVSDLLHEKKAPAKMKGGKK